MTDARLCLIAALALGCVRSVPPADSGDGPPSKPAPAEPQPSETETEPTPLATLENTAAALLEHAANIERVEVVKVDSRYRLGSLDAAGLERLREGLVDDQVLPDWTNTPPRWDVALEIHVVDRPEPFIAHPVGASRLRLNPIDPWSPALADSHELDVGEPVFELLEALIGDRVEPSKEHQPRPDRDLSKFRVEPSR